MTGWLVECCYVHPTYVHPCACASLNKFRESIGRPGEVELPCGRKTHRSGYEGGHASATLSTDAGLTT